MANTRRQFLKSSALVSLSPLVPNFWVAASAQEATARNDGQVLVVLQLTGGNDGLNTVIPFSDAVYRESRSTLAIAANDVLKIDGSLGFHPALKGFSELLQAGKLAVVQGVGYPNPNRSHFEAMDLWHTAHRAAGTPAIGWLGRYLDAAAKANSVREGGDAPAIHLGAEKQPLALVARDVPVPSVRSLERFRLENAGDNAVRQAIQVSTGAERAAGDDLLKFVQKSTTAALTTSRRVEEALGSYQTPVKYPTSELAGRLKSIAQLIHAGMTTRIYYVALDGFDTHSNQGAAHASLLGQIGDATKAFIDDLEHHGQAQRVVLMAFSEFGRRVKENASRGTDHGAAAPMFLAGGRVKAGVVGTHPSLTDLDDGDLKHHTDYRQVYATLLDGWLGGDSAQLLGKAYDKLPLLS